MKTHQVVDSYKFLFVPSPFLSEPFMKTCDTHAFVVIAFDNKVLTISYTSSNPIKKEFKVKSQITAIDVLHTTVEGKLYIALSSSELNKIYVFQIETIHLRNYMREFHS